LALFASEKVIAAHVPRTHIEAMPEHLDLADEEKIEARRASIFMR
jgi:hypothetical protein